MSDAHFQRIVGKYSPDFAMAYGSGVFCQQGYAQTDRPMVDFVFGVLNPIEWHADNVQKHPTDYWWPTRFFGARQIAQLQELGPGIYYNTYVEFEGTQIKYGVASLSRILKDLANWQTLYVAGRLQKPCLILAATPEIEKAQTKNLEHALNTAALLLPENFSEKELFLQIASLSYVGDSRMGLAENRNKVTNIVNANYHRFQDWYRAAISSAEWLMQTGEQFIQDLSPRTTERRFHDLPFEIRARVPVEIEVNKAEQLQPAIADAIRQIVYGPSVQQSLKGIVTAGPMKSLKYLMEKLRKARRN